MKRLLGVAIALCSGLAACGDDGGGTGSEDAGLVPGECGDGTLNTGEGCDDGNTTPGDGCNADCQGEPLAMRINELTLMDPHIFVLAGVDLTNTVNELIADEVTMDGDDPPDGNLDVSFVLRFTPYNPDASSTPLDLVFPDCTAPMASTSCTATDAPPVDLTANNMNAVCLDALPDTTGGYQPPLQPATAPCFATDPIDITVPVGDFDIPLEEGQVAATYGDGTILTNGVIRGFLSEAAAQNVTIPADIPIVGGNPLTEILSEDDQDMGPGGVTGWWFYLNFRADVVPYTE